MKSKMQRVETVKIGDVQVNVTKFKNDTECQVDVYHDGIVRCTGYIHLDEFEDVDTFWTTFFKKGICEIPGTVNKPFWKVKTPYKTGQVITVICDACGGETIQQVAKLDGTVLHTIKGCVYCKGNPELSVKVTAISVVNNEFRMEGQEL
jgi:hypothetical protein